MKKTLRALYLLEFFVGFAPSVLILCVGIIFSPIYFVGLFSGAPEVLLYLFLVISGSFGFWGAISLLTLTLHPENENTSPFRLRVYLLLGLLASLIVSIFIVRIDNPWSFVFILPFVVTTHLAYKQRYYIMQKCS
ncbi:hypothetical protein [Pseudoalteromonas sp. A25]|uniref:hypothetical protein n=1 Tax=Pseudoalteromonas sp. A25 TaxID=116092 RepID=UPI0012607885|nr:hypothetical protein [Pseudoalteromonas sp. A25]